MRNILTIQGFILALVMLVLGLAIIAWLWPVIVGLFWTLAIAAVFAYAAYLVLQARAANTPGMGVFQQPVLGGWPLLIAIVIFLVIILIGSSITMATWRHRQERPRQHQTLPHGETQGDYL